MRVLIVSHLALPHVGGVEILVDKEVRALTAAGHEVVVLTSDGGDGEPPSYGPAARVVRVPAWHGLERRFRLPYPVFGPRLPPALWREVGACDVVHGHGFIFMNTVLALLVAWLRGRRRVLTDHGGYQQFDSPLQRLLQRVAGETAGRLSARLGERLVTYNTRVGRLLERLAGTARKSVFLANPVDRGLFHPPTPQEKLEARRALNWDDRPKVLFVGRLVPEKGVSVLLTAADPAFDLVFCGPGDPGILGDPLPRGVAYLPPRPQAELLLVYRAADVFVLPSTQREGFPLVIQEALVCGLRVITCPDPGYEPYRRLPGLSFCERRPEGLRAAILAALAGPPPTDDGALDDLCPSLEVWLQRLYASADGAPAGPVPAPVATRA